MARTPIITAGLIVLPGNSAILNQAGQAIDQVNGMTLPIATTGIPAAASFDRLVLYVTNTFAGVATVTVRRGTNVQPNAGVNAGYTGLDPNAPAFEAGKGDLVTGNLTASTGNAFIGPFDIARFIQSDGSISIDFSASMTGLIWAILSPRSF
jgi:hypothetical protein